MTPEQKAAKAVEDLMIEFECEFEMAAESGGPTPRQWTDRIKRITALKKAHPAIDSLGLDALDFCEAEARRALEPQGKRQSR